mgnify:CR=1 FL=1
MGNGIIKLSITWQYTNMLRGSNPSDIAIVVGITLTNRVTMRLSQMLTFIPNKPSIMV